MKQWKTFFSILSLLVCMGLFAGCGNKDTGATPTLNPTATAVPTETVNTPEATATSTPKPTATNTPVPTATSTPAPTTRPLPIEEELTGYNAFELTAGMTVGWNLGNCLDSTGDHITFDTAPTKAATAWGNEEPTKELFEAVKAAGFNTVRIPTTWYQHIKYDNEKDRYVINEDWMAYVKQTVDYAYDLNLFVILNVHHEEWANVGEFTEDTYAKASKMLTDIWTQVSDVFAEYDQHLIFEAMNEPRQTGLGSSVEWGGGDTESWKYINDLNQVMVDVVRGQGSAANSERLIMLPGYGASSNIPTVKSIAVPENGGNIALSVHAYYPYYFAMDSSDKANHEFPGKSGYGENYATSIDSLFRQLKAVSADKNVPIIIGEFGASDFDNNDSRARWATYFLTRAKDAGIPCVFWDNQATYNGTGEAYGLISRKSYTWFENSIPMLEAAMKVYGLESVFTPYEAEVKKEFNWADIPVAENWVELYHSEEGKELAAWANYSLPDWKPYVSAEYDIILVYQSDSEPYMVLQGGWHKVFSGEGSDNPYVIRFTYDDVINTMTVENVRVEDMTNFYASASQSPMTMYGVYAVPAEENEEAANSASTPGTEQAEGGKDFLPTEEYVRTIGRTQWLEDTLWMAHSGAGIEFSVTATKVSITLKADNSCIGSADGQARIAVYVNGKRVADEMMNKAEKTISVLESETEESCVIRVVKLSESANSTVGMSKITVTAAEDIQPTENKEKLVEFIGDSITCGYGVDDEVKEHHFSTKTEDVTKTYAYKTAENLGVDYSMVSFSGYGIISGYTGSGDKNPTQTLPQYYDKLGFSYGTYMGKNAPQNVSWDFAKRQPDLIVINLGTNDNSYVLGKADRKEEYTTEYVEFLKKVRVHNPEATILCVLGIMGGDLYPAIEDAIARYQSETGDANVYSMKFEAQLWSDGYAADWHPTETTHTKAAAKLTAKIKEIMGW